MSRPNSVTIPPIHPVIQPIQKRVQSKQAGYDVSKLPESYRTLTPDEETIVEYVDNFRKQFGQLYPNRTDILLFPKNECGVTVCT